MSIEQYFNTESHGLGYERGYRDALDLAEAAIKKLPRLRRFMDGSELIDLPDIVTAIDLMREVK